MNSDSLFFNTYLNSLAIASHAGGADETETSFSAVNKLLEKELSLGKAYVDGNPYSEALEERRYWAGLVMQLADASLRRNCIHLYLDAMAIRAIDRKQFLQTELVTSCNATAEAGHIFVHVECGAFHVGEWALVAIVLKHQPALLSATTFVFQHVASSQSRRLTLLKPQEQAILPVILNSGFDDSIRQDFLQLHTVPLVKLPDVVSLFKEAGAHPGQTLVRLQTIAYRAVTWSYHQFMENRASLQTVAAPLFSAVVVRKPSRIFTIA